MKDKRNWVGVALSITWLVIAAGIFSTNTHPDKLNEWGDFFAGFSAPLAFLWLVIGYLQQGEELKNNTEMLRLQAEELKHSTDALRLQAEELKNSVEQQTQLVAVSREQVQLDLQVIAEERERRRAMARPKFVAERTSSIESHGVRRHHLKVTNVGPVATEVEITISPDAEVANARYSSFGPHHEFKSSITYATDADYKLRIKYVDSDGVPGEVLFPILVSRNNMQIAAPQRTE